MEDSSLHRKCTVYPFGLQDLSIGKTKESFLWCWFCRKTTGKEHAVQALCFASLRIGSRQIKLSLASAKLLAYQYQITGAQATGALESALLATCGCISSSGGEPQERTSAPAGLTWLHLLRRRRATGVLESTRHHCRPHTGSIFAGGGELGECSNPPLLVSRGARNRYNSALTMLWLYTLRQTSRRRGEKSTGHCPKEGWRDG
jgi:hypothetical protein